MNRALLVVNYNNMVFQNQRDSFVDACKRWEAAYIEVTENEVEYSGHPGAIKLRAFEFCAHDQLFVLDADTIIRIDTPSPFEVFPPDTFCACINKQPQLGPHYIGAGIQIEHNEMNFIFKKYPRLDFDYDRFINTGMFMCYRRHQPIMERAFEIYETTDGLIWWDQSAFNYALAEAQEPIHFVDTTWNWCGAPNELHGMRKYIYHYAGNPSRYGILPKIDWRAVS